MENNEVMKLVVSHLERIEKKVDKLDDRMDESDKTLIRNTASLEEHMKRSDLLEESQNDLKKAVTPIIQVYTVAWGILKIGGAMAVIVALLAGLKNLLT